MADLGAIAKSGDEFGKVLIAPLPAYAPTRNLLTFKPMNGTLGGTVLESGVPVADVRVTVLWRPSMQPIARTYTDAAGEWSVDGVDPTDTENYVVVIHDKEGGTVYNDAIYALVAPV